MALEKNHILDDHIIALPRIAVEDQQNAEVQVVKVGLFDISLNFSDYGGVCLAGLVNVVFETGFG